ncbi:KilA-N domain-containing protein [Pandoraea sp. PE-S2T-3]|uniref:KilA-N domain-containing protein n=1 Tax=Pandoraea sp. PE-S2T-3 TaxID=1986993 RepID=UPI001596010E|nr:KilA-N domain-containing protein [Pandoraea sp. PE-S2T-3]
MAVSNPIFLAEYQGLAVPFLGDGWFNATVAAKRFEKRVDNWLRLDETKTYIAALTEMINPSHLRDFVRTQRGRNGGTWMHPKLGVVFARWCDVRFAVWCDIQIEQILRGGVTIWDKACCEQSTTNDREALLIAAAALVARHRLSYSAVYKALNTFSGVTHAREMTCGQVLESTAFADRLLKGVSSSADHARFALQIAGDGFDGTQLLLSLKFAVPSDESH